MDTQETGKELDKGYKNRIGLRRYRNKLDRQEPEIKLDSQNIGIESFKGYRNRIGYKIQEYNWIHRIQE